MGENRSRLASSQLCTRLTAVATRPPPEPWTVADEERLQELKSQDVPMKETAVAMAANQMARAVTNNIAQLDEEVRRTLLDSLRDSSMDEG